MKLGVLGSESKLKIGWLSTGNGNGSYGMLSAVVEAIANHQLKNIEIAYLGCTRELGEDEGSDSFIQYADELGIPVETLSWKHFKLSNKAVGKQALREMYDTKLYERVKDYGADLAVMAGYMLVSARFHWRVPCLNLHPALPGGPKGTWESVVRELQKSGAHESGVTIHRVTDDLDAGAPIAVWRYSISGLGAEEVRQRGLKHERTLMVLTLGALADGELPIQGELAKCLYFTESVGANSL